jgi:hypothetical protein
MTSPGEEQHRTGDTIMLYLNVTPMITALRETPDEFELAGGWLNHIRSRHSFRFGPTDEVDINAACNCALLAVRPEQKRELANGYQEWKSNYWQPLQINREFASHFSRRPAWHQTLISLTGRLHRWLLCPQRNNGPAGSQVQTS